MKTSPGLLLAILFSTSALLAQPQVLIDTDFSRILEDGQLATVEAAGSEADLPLRAPTRFSALAPSAITAGTEVRGELKPPYALFKDDGREEKPEASGNLSMNWGLKNLGLASGKYELSYEVTPLSSEIRGARFQVTFLGEDGKGVSMHIGEQPVYANFARDRIVINAGRGGAGIPFEEGLTYLVKIRFDLDQKVWSASVDGNPLGEEISFGSAFLEACPNPAISGVSINHQAGYGDSPNASWAVSAVKLVRLE